MVRIFKIILVVLGVVILILLITAIPFVTSSFQDSNILNKEIQISDTPIVVKSHTDEPDISMDDKILMAWNKNLTEQFNLKTGRLLTEEQAKEICQQELEKITPVDGIAFPSLENYSLHPVLFINIDDPTITMVVWSGMVKLNGLIYEWYLEEESKKIIYIQGLNFNQDIKKFSQLEQNWKDYITSQ